MFDLSSLNKSQTEAVTVTEGPILVVAGAGTGKTRVLTMRITYLINELGYNPNKILAFTFTNKAANEMRTRIFNTLKNIYVPWIGTYHATCLKILREDVVALGRSNSFTVLDEEDKLTLVRDIYKQYEIPQKTIKPNKMIDVISRIKTNDIDLNNIISIDTLKSIGLFKFDDLKIVKVVYKKYQIKLLESNLLDFDDLLLLTHKLLSEHKDIRTKWQDNFHYILVDEFQDTNKIQFDILNYLIDPKKQNVFAVGDPDQTIYTWRGAYSEIFNDFLAQYRNTKICILDLNYRSTKNILKSSNKLISHNSNRIKKELETHNPVGNDVVFFNGDTQYQEANYVVSQINKLVKANEASYKDIAILYRANYLSRFIEQELISNSIPYYIYGGFKFYQRMEIKDVLAYLKLITNPNDELSLKRVVNIPRRNIGTTTINRIEEYAYANKISFLEAFYSTMDQHKELPWTKMSIALFINFMEKMRNETSGKTIVNTLDYIIKQTNYEDHLKSYDNDAETKLENLKELKAGIQDFEVKNPGSTIQNYLQEIILYTDPEENRKSKDNSISLMTVHVAKGSEYKVIFVVGLNEGVFPINKMGETTDMEEERRVAYVAMTRSKEKLFLTCSGGFSYITGANLSPSRFIKEIGSHNLKHDSQRMISINKTDLDWFNSHENVNYDNSYVDEDINFHVGDVIAHTVFGAGIIVGVKNDVLDISFKSPYGVKSIVKNHKSIKRIKN